MNSENKLTFIDKFAKYNRAFDTSFFMFLSFFILTLVLVGVFVLAYIYMSKDKTVTSTILSSEVLHLILMGSFGLVQSIAAFLFGKKLGEVNGNNDDYKKEVIQNKIAEVNSIIEKAKESLG